MVAKVSDVGEALSTLRELARVRADLRPIVPHARCGDDVVVLVHGFLASAGVFRPMRARLEREANARVATFSHAPGLGVKRIARQLAEIVDRIPHGTRVHLVGHSLGGIVVRWYVQEMGATSASCRRFSLATPFGGVRVAESLRVFVGNDLHAASDVLARLRERARSCEVPHTSIAGTEDRVVGEAARARFAHGEWIELPGRGHNALLFDRESIAHVVEKVKSAHLF